MKNEEEGEEKESGGVGEEKGLKKLERDVEKVLCKKLEEEWNAKCIFIEEV